MLFVLLSGAPHSGKSTWLEGFLRSHLDARIKVVDIYHIQNQLVLEDADDIAKAYILILQEIKFALVDHHDDHDIVVAEAPLCSERERALFYDVFKKYSRPEDHSVLVWCSTSDDTLRERLSSHSDCEYDIEEIISEIERPRTQEGLDCVIYHENDGAGNSYVDLARMHCGVDTDNIEEAKSTVKRFETEWTGEYPRGLVYVIEDQIE